jgi:DsbC/DsbD-like thiol-disulfide interchange protein/cytochrome c biogenesis protein CcdA
MKAPMKAPRTVLLAAVLAAAVLAPAPVRGAASEWSTNPQSKVRLVTPWVVAPRIGELVLGLEFELAPGWHVYWKNSGDAGFPPSVTFQPEAILGKPELLWPQPRRFELPGGLVALGYEGRVVYPVVATIRPGSILPPAPEEQESEEAQSVPITADLDYLVCEVDCIPYRYTLTVDQKVGFPTLVDPETSPLLGQWLDRLPKTLADVSDVKASTVLDTAQNPPDLEVRLVGVEEQPGKTDLFLEAHEALDAGRPRARSFPGGVVFHVPMKPRDATKPLPEKLEVGWTATNLSKGGQGFDLEAHLPVQMASAPASRPPGSGEPASPRRLVRLLLWAFLGGVLLHLAPPVLALLVGETLALRGSTVGAREGAAAAATGIVGTCWAVAGLAILASRAGIPAGWGAELQEPPAATLLAIASAILALNLWGLMEVPLAPAGTQPGEKLAGTGRHLLAGVFTVPLALAWPVPLLQEPIGYAFGRGPATVCAVYSVLGFGLALPYLLFLAVPGLIRRLPEPGAWLPRLREGLGFLAGAGTLWLLYSLSRQVSREGLAWIELSLLGLGLAAWLRAREGTGRVLRMALVLGLAACGATALWMADLNRFNDSKPGLSPVSPDLPAATEPNPTSGG